MIVLLLFCYYKDLLRFQICSVSSGLFQITEPVPDSMASLFCAPVLNKDSHVQDDDTPVVSIYALACSSVRFVDVQDLHRFGGLPIYAMLLS